MPKRAIPEPILQNPARLLTKFASFPSRLSGASIFASTPTTGRNCVHKSAAWTWGVDQMSNCFLALDYVS